MTNLVYGTPSLWYNIYVIDITDYREKTDGEVEAVRRAQEITDKAYAKVLPQIKSGMTELQLADIIERELLECGAEETAFPTIVAFGKNALDPHAVPGKKRLKAGLLIMMDFGAKLGGYCSDMTRTVAFKKASELQRFLYNAVLEAQEATIEQLKVGAVCEEIHAFATAQLAKYRLERYFPHGTGHGVGLKVHEAPSFHRYDKNCPKDVPLEEYKKTGTPIKHNSVVTVEPGIYYKTLFKKIGVRIEDLVLVTNDGIEILTKTPKQLLILE